MEKTTLNMEDTGSENKGRYVITQLNKTWCTIVEYQNEWLYFARAPRGEKHWEFLCVDDLRISDVDACLDDDNYMLFMLTSPSSDALFGK